MRLRSYTWLLSLPVIPGGASTIWVRWVADEIMWGEANVEAGQHGMTRRAACSTGVMRQPDRSGSGAVQKPHLIAHSADNLVSYVFILLRCLARKAFFSHDNTAVQVVKGLRQRFYNQFTPIGHGISTQVGAKPTSQHFLYAVFSGPIPNTLVPGKRFKCFVGNNVHENV